jgi:hypothetical protein
MINTINIKQAQLTTGFYTVGTGETVILIMGSCRVCPYINYFDEWNRQNGNKFTIHTLDPFNWNWNINDDRVDYMEALLKCESSLSILNMLASVDVFIHEYYQNAGMFNCDLTAQKNIYNYGLKPSIDICIPNFNDLFILAGDIVSFDAEIRKNAIADYNVLGKLSEQTEKQIFEKSQDNARKFGNICLLSDIPEMGTYFLQEWINKRLWWTYNHVTKNFTLFIFEMLCKKIGLETSSQLIEEISKEDMFANNYTYLTEYDMKFYNFKWGEEIKPLRDKL